MKRLLKIMSVMMLTSVTTVNVVGCDFFQDHYPQIDKEQRLTDAANLIANNKDTNFVNFLQNKKQTTVNDFQKLIMNNIAALFWNYQQQEDFSNITYRITNVNDAVNLNTVGIKLQLSWDDINKDCTFNATFKSLQAYVDNKLDKYVKDKAFFTIEKSADSLYENLIKAGADFTKPEAYLTNVSQKAQDFWKKFQEVWPTKEEPYALGFEVIAPVLNFISPSDGPKTNLTPDNFKPALFNADKYVDVIAITGKKKFIIANKEETCPYIKITLVGQDSNTVSLGNTYHNLTFVFKGKS